jgi:hypothetical protein
MKNSLILVVFLFFTTTLFSQQNKFKLDENSPVFPDQFVVLKVDSLSVKKAFYKTLAWIKNTYDAPSEVIKSQSVGKHINIEGSGKLYYAQAFGLGNFYDTKYQITFSFQEGIVRFEITKMIAYFPPTDLLSGRWAVVEYQNKDLYKGNGKLRKTKAKNYNMVLSYFNDLVISLKNYLLSPEENLSKEVIL